MTPLGTLIALAVGEAFLGLLFGGLFLRLSRIHGRADLRFWTRAWGFLLLHLGAFVLDGLVESAGFGPATPPRALTIAFYIATSNLGVVSLGIGAATFAARREFSRDFVRGCVGGAIGVGVVIGIALVLGVVPEAAHEFFREGVRGLVAGAVALGVAVQVWPHDRGSVGAGLTKAGLIGLGLAQFHYAFGTFVIAPHVELGWPLVYFAIADMLVWTLLGAGTVTWLLEQERTKVVDGARAREVLERNLRQQDLRLDAIINGVQELIIILDQSGTIVFSGHRESPVTRFTPADVVGTSLEWHVHPDDLDKAQRAFRDVLARPDAESSLLCRVRTKEGGWVMLDCVARNHQDEPGIHGILVTARDVTEKQRLESQLHHAQRMESLGRLAGGVAHDFNNLLTVITGNAQLGRAALAPGSPGDSELNEIVAAADRAAGLTRQLLSFARREVVEPRTLDPSALIGRLENMLRRLIGEHIDLSIELMKEPAFVRADPGQIEQVVINLAANARDAMADGGRLSIGAWRFDASVGPKPAADMADGAYLALSVRDTGPGIADHVKPHLFEPFFTTKAPGLGTGLGLATCYGIAGQSGGYIGVESEPGLGSTFTLYLPEVEAPAAVALSASGPGPATGGELILVVEDEPAVRLIAVRSLKARGFEVLEAEDGEAALAVLAFRGDIRCLVTDVVMPRLGGVALVREVRARGAEFPVLFTSGYADQLPMAEGFSGQTEFLQKPYSPSVLAARVRILIDKWTNRLVSPR